MKFSYLRLPQTSFQHPSILHFCLNHPRIAPITSPSKMTTVLIRRNAPTDSCHNLTALMPRCTKTQFLLNPHYTRAHSNSDNLHNAVFIGYSLVARVYGGRTPYCGITSSDDRSDWRATWSLPVAMLLKLSVNRLVRHARHLEDN